LDVPTGPPGSREDPRARRDRARCGNGPCPGVFPTPPRSPRSPCPRGRGVRPRPGTPESIGRGRRRCRGGRRCRIGSRRAPRSRRPLPSDNLPERDGSAGSTARASTESGIADRLDVDAALSRLTPEYRAAVALRDLVGMDYAEIAEVLGIPAGTVRSRISRGRAALADLLGNRETPSEHPTT
jgi:hypothetical protein